MTKILHLTLKKKWFDMILSGEKKEEYREIKPFWINRLVDEIRFEDKERPGWFFCKVGMATMETAIHYDKIIFRNGYSKDAPTMTVECLDITTGLAKFKWADGYKGVVFIIKLGNILETKNLITNPQPK